ncbi:unnamed protein product [Haemonchus placei]|uniref:Uncharacterized protein n=1 Tax=Haemonchus placei TaxID=6290 RepID=A0A3P7XUS6_HAEPC|nr:unnamed protein product [Haemonchus placei]
MSVFANTSEIWLRFLCPVDVKRFIGLLLSIGVLVATLRNDSPLPVSISFSPSIPESELAIGGRDLMPFCSSSICFSCSASLVSSSRHRIRSMSNSHFKRRCSFAALFFNSMCFFISSWAKWANFTAFLSRSLIIFASRVLLLD